MPVSNILSLAILLTVKVLCDVGTQETLEHSWSQTTGTAYQHLLQCCFTSTETVQTIASHPQRLYRLLLHIHRDFADCCFTSTETVQTIVSRPQRLDRLLGTGIPGCPPGLSCCSWALHLLSMVVNEYIQAQTTVKHSWCSMTHYSHFLSSYSTLASVLCCKQTAVISTQVQGFPAGITQISSSAITGNQQCWSALCCRHHAGLHWKHQSHTVLSLLMFMDFNFSAVLKCHRCIQKLVEACTNLCHQNEAIAPSPLCSCSLEKQTAQRVLLTCPSYNMLRKTHWPVETPLQTKFCGHKQELELDSPCRVNWSLIRHAEWTVFVISDWQEEVLISQH